jgi:transketolase
VPLCRISYKKIQGFRKVKGLGHKPLDNDAVLAAARQTKAIITVEEHSIIGGLGSAVAEVLAESGNSHTTFRRIGIKDEFCQQVGSQEYLRRIYGLSVDSIVDAIELLMGRGIVP